LIFFFFPKLRSREWRNSVLTRKVVLFSHKLFVLLFFKMIKVNHNFVFWRLLCLIILLIVTENTITIYSVSYFFPCWQRSFRGERLKHVTLLSQMFCFTLMGKSCLGLRKSTIFLCLVLHVMIWYRYDCFLFYFSQSWLHK